MIVFRRAEEIKEWFVCFHRTCSHPFWQRFIPGRWKHVRAFAFSHGAQCWIFYDVWLLGGTRITLAPAGEAGDDLVGQYTRAALVVKLTRQPDRKLPITSRFGFWCVTAVRHLLNLPGGALLPETLLRDLLRTGASVVVDEPTPRPTA